MLRPRMEVFALRWLTVAAAFGGAGVICCVLYLLWSPGDRGGKFTAGILFLLGCPAAWCLASGVVKLWREFGEE